MIRSNFAITRLIVLPYGALLALHLVVVGGGGAWLYLEVRGVETRLRINEIMTAVQPLADKLGLVDALGLMQRNEPWLISEIERLFAMIPSLRTVSIRGPDAGFQIKGGVAEPLAPRATSPLPAGARRTSTFAPAAQRLHAASDPLFLIRFDLTDETVPLVRLDLGFDRAVLVERIDEGVLRIKQAVVGFGVAGAVSIVLALIISVVAMCTTRKVEGHFQDIYQRAAMTEMAAALVHDLRNPLSALRSNAKALLVSPEQTREIVAELDRDIVTLNDKLSAFLSLTRPHNERFVPVDVRELIGDAARLAEPVLAKHGLRVKTDSPPDLPNLALQKLSMRDALLNVIINAAQSGQNEGVIHVRIRMDDGALEIVVEDQGEGIAENHLPHLFDAFYTTRVDGTGLGLAIVKDVVAAHQGKVRAENRPQGGARIVLTLPWQQPETPQWWKNLKKRSPA